MTAKELGRECEKHGWKLKRTKGSHRIYTKKNEPRPIVIPKRKGELLAFIVSNVRRQLVGAKKVG